MPWIDNPRIEGIPLHQAHLPEPYEREFGKEGFYGPVGQMYPQHPSVNWLSFEGGIRLRVFGTRNSLDVAEAAEGTETEDSWK